MSKILRLTESELTKVIRKVILEINEPYNYEWKGQTYQTSGAYGHWSQGNVPIMDREKMSNPPPPPSSCVKTFSKRAVDIIKGYEGFMSQIYDDKCPHKDVPSIKDKKASCGGKLTIGYGTLIKPYPEFNKYLKGSNNHLSEPTGEKYLKSHIEKKVYPEISEKITACLNQNQFDALCVLCYNVGSIGENLQRGINTNDEKTIREYWVQYIKVDGVKDTRLLPRRKAELNLFFTRSI